MTIIDYLQTAMNKQKNDRDENIKAQTQIRFNQVDEKFQNPSFWKIDENQATFQCEIKYDFYCEDIQRRLYKKYHYSESLAIKCTKNDRGMYLSLIHI